MATLSSTQLAARLHTDPKTLRRFLRDSGKGVGQGKRYQLQGNKVQLTSLQKKFEAWKKN